MMKHEFEELYGGKVSDESYKNIEFIYMHLEKLTKRDCAKLYKHNSYLIDVLLRDFFKDNDNKISELKSDISDLMVEKENLQTRNEELKNINDSYINAIMNQSDVISFLHKRVNESELRIEELEIQLQQYRTLFGSIIEILGSV